MKLTANDLRTTYWIVARWRRSEILAGHRIEPPVAALMERLDREIRWAVSPSRQPDCPATGDLVSERNSMELIGSRLAADILGWHGDAGLRRIQRRAADLGGRCVGGRLVFRANVVRAYREQMEF